MILIYYILNINLLKNYDKNKMLPKSSKLRTSLARLARGMVKEGR